MAKEFIYKETFPDAAAAFSFQLKPLKEVVKNGVVVLDTSVLLTPFTTSIRSLEAIEKVYERLRKEERLFVPSQVIREFIANRPGKISELYDSLSKKLNQNYNYVGRHPLLEQFGEFKQMLEKENELKKALSDVREQIQVVMKVVKSWEWNDPVSIMYQNVLQDCIFDKVVGKPEDLLSELKKRNESNIPPGFRDDGKSENSGGDFLIWKEILAIGKSTEKDLIFVTNDVKNDWWYVSNKERLYPRIELVDEYRRCTQNNSFHIMTLSELLQYSEVDDTIVEEIKSEEKLINGWRLELDNRATQILGELYTLMREYEHLKMSLAYNKKNNPLPPTSPEEAQLRHSMQEQQIKAITESILQRYQLQYKDKAIAIRNEMVEFLNKNTSYTIIQAENAISEEINDMSAIYAIIQSLQNYLKIFRS